MKYLFLDTNFLLHFKSFDEIDWKSLLNEDEITIVITPTVISELDKHKQHNVSRVRKRARSTLKKIESYFDDGITHKKILIEILTTEPKSEIFDSYELEKDVPDDRILASILEFKIKDKDVCLVSNDSGPRLKAKSRDIEVFKIPSHLQLKSQIDPIEKENQKLKQEIERIKNRLPQLKLLFRNGDDHMTINLEKADIKKPDIDNILKNVKKQYPHISPQGTDQKSPFHALANFNQPTPEQINEFNAKLDEFYQEYSFYLKLKHIYEIKKYLTFSIEFDLINFGTAPADDIDIFIHFQDGFELCNPDDVMSKPKEPIPPTKPKNRLDLSGYSAIPNVSHDFFQSPISSEIPSFTKPTIKKTNSYNVEYSVNSLKHGLNEELDQLALTFDSYDSATNFRINYDISCANITEIINGSLDVIVKK